MGLINLVFSPRQKTTIGSLTLDALLTEINTYNSDVTEYTVEEGAPITDNIGQKSRTLSIKGVVTGAGVSLFEGGGKVKMIAAKEVIKQIHEQQLPVTIVTGMEIYRNFGMETCTVTRSDSLEKLNIEATFKKIKLATPKETDLPPEKVRKKPSKAGGKSAQGKAGKTKQNAGTLQKEQKPTSTMNTTKSGISESVTKILSNVDLDGVGLW
ncbi:phage baseplate protein [Phocoenobacter skyensis]|uniref:Dit-like phage tail protein N-terminal domain-containing protein n=1 Tax=Phocoenobacter skyensis TaxID=97481 RepID=A0A1H7XXV0_9PAST|nr:hypothetical protein [Pasteurella skyensis]QLB23313.1 hypothetical protein A6B44_08885 [Pasteurella skyensis]SEM37779.1 hypothetical protein SAMN05444853_11462 [Pasteurella skyensis]